MQAQVRDVRKEKELVIFDFWNFLVKSVSSKAVFSVLSQLFPKFLFPFSIGYYS